MMRFMSTVVALQYDLLCILICRVLISTAMRVPSAIFGVKIICKKLIRNIMTVFFDFQEQLEECIMEGC